MEGDKHFNINSKSSKIYFKNEDKEYQGEEQEEEEVDEEINSEINNIFREKQDNIIENFADNKNNIDTSNSKIEKIIDGK